MAEPAFLGRGLITPFRRDRKGDFQVEEGAELVRGAVRQIIGTRGASISGQVQGELPWRTDFGSLIHTIRHLANDEVLRELVRTHTQDALARWEPRIVLRQVTADRDLRGNKLTVRIVYSLITRDVPGNRVLTEPEVAEVVLPLAA